MIKGGSDLTLTLIVLDIIIYDYRAPQFIVSTLPTSTLPGSKRLQICS